MSISTLRPQVPNLKRAGKLVQRNLTVYRYTWMVIFSGFFEPLFYLVAVGFGLGTLVGTVTYQGVELEFAAFLAPGMLAASTMNGAITDGFFNPFFKLHYLKTYDGILATPLKVTDIAVGEMMWAQLRGSIYAIGFLIVMVALGLVLSPWAILALPAAMLSAAALSAGAMILTATVKQIEAFDWVFNLIVMPMFLFSGTFFPVSVYPGWLQPLVQISPLYHSANLLRSLTTGVIGPDIIVNLAYLVGMFVVSTLIAARFMERQLIS